MMPGTFSELCHALIWHETIFVFWAVIVAQTKPTLQTPYWVPGGAQARAVCAVSSCL